MSWLRIEQLLIVLGGVENIGQFDVFTSHVNVVNECYYICINPDKLTQFQIESLTTDSGSVLAVCDSWCWQCPRAFLVPKILFKT